MGKEVGELHTGQLLTCVHTGCQRCPEQGGHGLSVLNSHLPNPKEIFFTKRPKNKKTSGARHGLNILQRDKPRVPSETKSPDERFNYFSPAQMPKNLLRAALRRPTSRASHKCHKHMAGPSGQP